VHRKAREMKVAVFTPKLAKAQATIALQVPRQMDLSKHGPIWQVPV
jgi:hypothetical protein